MKLYLAVCRHVLLQTQTMIEELWAVKLHEVCCMTEPNKLQLRKRPEKVSERRRYIEFYLSSQTQNQYLTEDWNSTQTCKADCNSPEGGLLGVTVQFAKSGVLQGGMGLPHISNISIDMFAWLSLAELFFLSYNNLVVHLFFFFFCFCQYFLLHPNKEICNKKEPAAVIP